MTTANSGSTSLALAPKSRMDRLFSRLTLGHLLAATLASGALMGAVVTKVVDEDPPERVTPSFVFHWSFGEGYGFEPAIVPRPEPAMGESCESGAFLGIEFRRDRERTHMALPWHHGAHGFHGQRMATAEPYYARVGVKVLNVLHGTAAEAMGLLPGDVIVEMDHVALNSASQLAHEIQSRCIGEQTVLRVHRKEQVKVLSGALRSRFRHRCGME